MAAQFYLFSRTSLIHNGWPPRSSHGSCHTRPFLIQGVRHNIHASSSIIGSSSFATGSSMTSYGERKTLRDAKSPKPLHAIMDRGGFHGGEGSGNSGNNSGGGRGGGGGGGRDRSDDDGGGGGGLGRKDLLSVFLEGWRSRVNTDPQFPFKVLMEQIVGVGANVLGDMASRPSFGLHELDFVFSTFVVGSMVNFALMYILAPTSLSSSSSSLPGIFSSCPAGHMFEPGVFSLAQRMGTFVFKGAVFACIGFSAGLLGTLISNVLIGTRKRMDPRFEPQNRAPPTLLNASTWALHMGLSSNLRYQAVNGLEFTLAHLLSSPPVFKTSVILIRAANNLLGGMSFVALAKLTGSQKVEASNEENKLD